jgi:hypothetical protein
MSCLASETVDKHGSALTFAVLSLTGKIFSRFREKKPKTL